MMAAALGERSVRAPGRPFSEYENSVGTGQMHLWFGRPAGGWTAGRRPGEGGREKNG
jgi:3,4-dihydroxyphenylacetate 2,3-dioxygenase